MLLLKSHHGCRDHGDSHSKNMARMIMLKAKNTMRVTMMKVPHIAHFEMVTSQSPMVMSQSLVKRYTTECSAITDEPSTRRWAITFG